jgi:hypothetical protein
MTTLSRTLIAAAALLAMATSAFSLEPWEFKSGTAYMYVGPGKMTAMSMANGAMGHDAMMKNATKVQDNTVFFMQGNQLYMAYGVLDAAGNFSRQ